MSGVRAEDLGAAQQVFRTATSGRAALLFLGVLALAYAILSMPKLGTSTPTLIGIGGCIAAGLVGIAMIVKGIRLRHLVVVHTNGVSFQINTLKPLAGAYRWKDIEGTALRVDRVVYNGAPHDTLVLAIQVRGGTPIELSEHIVKDLRGLEKAIAERRESRQGLF
jgi:hypothetical protein